LQINTHFKYLSSILKLELLTKLVFQWFPLHNVFTVEPILLRCTLYSIFDKQPLLCLMRQ